MRASGEIAVDPIFGNAEVGERRRRLHRTGGRRLAERLRQADRLRGELRAVDDRGRVEEAADDDRADRGQRERRSSGSGCSGSASSGSGCCGIGEFGIGEFGIGVTGGPGSVMSPTVRRPSRAICVSLSSPATSSPSTVVVVTLKSAQAGGLPTAAHQSSCVYGGIHFSLVRAEEERDEPRAAQQRVLQLQLAELQVVEPRRAPACPGRGRAASGPSPARRPSGPGATKIELQSIGIDESSTLSSSAGGNAVEARVRDRRVRDRAVRDRRVRDRAVRDRRVRDRRRSRPRSSGSGCSGSARRRTSRAAPAAPS